MIFWLIFLFAFLRPAILVGAIPQFLRRDEICIDFVTSTLTVTEIFSHTPSSTSNSNNVPTVTVVQTVTVTATLALLTTPSPASPSSSHVTVSTPGQPTHTTITTVLTQTITQTHTVVQTQTVTRTIPPSSRIGNPAGPISTTSSPRPTISLRPSVPAPYSNSSSTVNYSLPPISPRSTTSQSVNPKSTSSSSSSASSPSPSPGSPSHFNSSGYENSVYFTNWGIYSGNYQPESLPASLLTRVHYAFADIDTSTGSVVSSDSYADLQKHYSTDSWDDTGNNVYGCVKQLYLLKKQNRSFKVLLSIGGWTYSSKFSPVAADATMRQTFVSSAVKLVTDWGFDGVDLDWEFNAYTPASGDAENFVLLLQELRSALDQWAAQYAPGYHFLITVASPAGPATYGLLDISGMAPYVDSWNLMAYDYAGSWSDYSGHQANIFPNPGNTDATPFSTDKAVTDYLAKGVSASSILLGLPLYGRSFEGTSGLGKSYTGVGEGDGTFGVGQWRYKDLPRTGATEYYDSVADASYSYDGTAQELISYDNVHSTQVKSLYVRSKGLGGAMFWSADSDKNGTDSLILTMAEQLVNLDSSTNLLNYPTSQYANIRNNMLGS